DLDGMPPLEVPDDADREWWDTVEIGHLLDYWDETTERFDTIIVDEAQDFSPIWIELLTRLLDPDGPRRLLMLADESQEVYERGFTVPDMFVPRRARPTPRRGRGRPGRHMQDVRTARPVPQGPRWNPSTTSHPRRLGGMGRCD
ncbi:MAG TPA: UvrD-helicase domain-containing protein, partial [Ilumatobacter sp.]